MLLTSIHQTLANTIILYMLVCGLWGLVTYFRRGSVSPTYTGALLVGEVVIIAQGVVGMILVASGAIPGELIHLLYGVTSALALPLAFTYVKGRTDRGAQLVYSLVALFVFGLALRAFTTA